MNKIPQNVSESTRRRNPHLYGVGSLGSAQHQQEPRRALVKDASTRQKGGTDLAVIVTLIGHVSRVQDDDNFVRGCKPLRDAIARSLGIDDGSSRIRFEYGQVETKGDKGVTVKLQRN